MFGLLVLAFCFHLGTSHVCNVYYDDNFGGLFANCRGRELIEIPGDIPDNIVALDISGNLLTSLKNFAFSEYKNITYLNLMHNHLNKLGSDTFYGLPHLSFLNLASNDMGTVNSLNSLQPLIGRNVSELDMSSIFPMPAGSSKTTFQLTTRDTKYLTQICVREFSFRYNYIAYIEEDALFGEPFASCLEILDLSSNMLIGDLRVIWEVPRFFRLKRLVLSKQTSFSITSFPGQSVQRFLVPKYSVTLPSTLEYLEISNVGEYPPGAEITFFNATNLKNLRARSDRMSGQILIHGLAAVENLDLSGNNIGSVNTSFLDSFPIVVNLSLCNCQLRIIRDTQFTFKNLKRIQHIDLSQNMLNDLPTFPNPSDIRMLNLSGNAFDKLPLDMSTFESLETLDLSYNSITYLSEEDRNMLDEAFQKSSLSLHVHGNTFSCGCQHLDFLVWVDHTHVIKGVDRGTPCMQDDGTIVKTTEMLKNYVYVSRHCNGKMSLVLTVTLIIISLMSFIAVYIVAKNPYRYQNMILRLFGFTLFRYPPKYFRFKFFIAYCEADIPFVYQKVRPALELSDNPVHLFLKDREVLPGVDIADGIVEGINNSWKTLIVVSRDFLNDTWFNFTINTAIYSMTELIPDRVFVLLVGDVQVKDLPEMLLNAVDEDFIFHMDEYENKEQSLWTYFIEMNT